MKKPKTSNWPELRCERRNGLEYIKIPVNHPIQQYSRIQQYINYINDHGHQAREYYGKIAVLESWSTPEGKRDSKWVVIAADWQTVRDWLGY